VTVSLLSFLPPFSPFAICKDTTLRFSQSSFVLLLLCAFALGLLLPACNLQQSPAVTPTINPTQEQSAPTLAPTIFPSQLPLQSTPTQMSLTVAPLVVGTPVLVGTGAPTLNAALADDRYELTVRPGKTNIGVNLNLTLITGRVTLTLQGPTGIVWTQTFTASENSRIEVPITEGGTYEILVDIENFDGNYSLSWD
jgi:hypothetical protein